MDLKLNTDVEDEHVTFCRRIDIFDKIKALRLGHFRHKSLLWLECVGGS